MKWQLMKPTSHSKHSKRFIINFLRIESDLRTRREKNIVITGQKDEKKKIVIKLPEYQFYSNRDRLIELLTKSAEWDANKKSKSGANAEGDKEEDAEKEKELAANRGLTKTEADEKDRLLVSGYSDWTKDDYLSFVKACEKYGRKDFQKISEVSIVHQKCINRFCLACWN